MFTYKVDEEIVLKFKDHQDSRELFELIDRSRVHLKEWMTWVDEVQSVTDIETATKKHILAFADQRAIHMLIVYKGAVAGSININRIDWSIGSAEIGYWLGSGFTGEGIITRAVSSLLDYAFSNLNLHKIEIWAAEGNTKSRSIPERLGFIQEGMRRDDEWINGRYVTMMIYGMLKEEWQSVK